MDIFGRGGLLDLQDPLTYLGFVPFAGPAIRGASLLSKANKVRKAFKAPQTGVPMTGKYGTTQFFNVPGGPLNPVINNPITRNPLKTFALGGIFGPRLFDGQAGPESQANLLNVLDAPQQDVSNLNINLNPELPQENPYSLMPKQPNYFDDKFNFIGQGSETIAPEVITPEIEEADETIAQEVESVVEKIDPEKLSNKNRQIANMLFALSDVLRGKDPVPGALQRKQMFEAKEEENIRRENALAMVDNIMKDLPADSPLRKRINMIDQFSEIDPYAAASAAINLVEQNEQEKQAKTDYISFVQSLGLDDSQTTTFEKLPIDIGYKIVVDMAYGKSEPTAAMKNANEFLKVQEAFNNNEISENVYNSLRSIYGADRGRGKTRKEYLLEFTTKIYQNEYLSPEERDDEINQFKKALDKYFPDSVTTNNNNFTTPNGKYKVKPLQG